jgi:hypothetical protein
MRAAGALLLAFLALPAPAHDLITPESAQAYLARQERLAATLQGKAPAAERAGAALELGGMLDEIRVLFNRDIEAHGQVQGLPSNFLMAELRRRGNALAWSPARNRFLANLSYYHEALKLEPDGPTSAEASFRVLQGWFYDSFTDDPLAPTSQSPAQLAEQIRLGEQYLRRYPQHAGNEEATFILAVHYMQAALSAERRKRPAWSRKAKDLSAGYAAAHPENLRTATLAALLERIEGG